VTLQEAIKTGRPFKSPTWKNQNGIDPWLDQNSNQIFFKDTRKNWSPSIFDIEANDYEIKECVEVDIDDLRKILTDYVVKFDIGLETMPCPVCVRLPSSSVEEIITKIRILEIPF